jgi:hypothetical protein
MNMTGPRRVPPATAQFADLTDAEKALLRTVAVEEIAGNGDQIAAETGRQTIRLLKGLPKGLFV